MSAATKSPAELMADLTDQVRLLRQDVANLTASAPTKAEAAKITVSVQKAANEAFERSQQAIRASEHLGQRIHRDSASAAQAAAERAIKGLEQEIRDAANRMRLEAVRGRQQALYGFGGGLAVFGGMIALGAVLGTLAFALIQGRGDARAFGKYPGVYCRSAGGEVATGVNGRRFCAFWIDPPTQVN